MPMTEEERAVALANADKGARALAVDERERSDALAERITALQEQIDALPPQPSPDVMAGAVAAMIGAVTALLAGTDEANLAMLARVNAAITGETG